MFLTVHATVGAFIGQSIPNPWVAFVLGFLSHFVVDCIPHGDQSIAEGNTHRERVKNILILVAMDFTVLGILAWFWYTTRTFAHPLSTVLGAFGAMLPDGLQGITEFSNGRYFSRFKHFHDQFHVHTHAHLHRFVVPFSLGLPIQILFLYIVQRYLGV